MVLGATDAQFEGSLKIALMADIKQLYPWDNRRQESAYVLDNVYEPLIRFKEGSSDIGYWLATAVTPAPDFRVWTVQIRKNVYFHDGSMLNADAVVASLSMVPALRNKVKRINEYTVAITLDKPSVLFPDRLTLMEYSIVSLATVKCYHEKCKPLVLYGTGPFTFSHWTPGKEVVLKANLKYWGKKPFLKEAIFLPFKSDADLIKAIKEKQINIALAVSPNSITAIREIPHVTFRTVPTLGIGILALNTEKKSLNDARVRKAIAYAINKKELVKKYYFGGHTGAVAQTFVPPQIMKLYEPSADFEYNPEKAKALLKEAGYPDGFKVTLVPIYIHRPYMPDPPGIAEDIAVYLSAIGIKAKVILVGNEEEFKKMVLSNTYDMMLFGWHADVPDPDDLLTALLSTESINDANLSRWSNKQFDGLLEEARKKKTPVERLEYYQKAQTLFHQELPFIPLFTPLQTIAWSENVNGFVPHPVNRFYLQEISLRK